MTSSVCGSDPRMSRDLGNRVRVRVRVRVRAAYEQGPAEYLLKPVCRFQYFQSLKPLLGLNSVVGILDRTLTLTVSAHGANQCTPASHPAPIYRIQQLHSTP